MVGIVGTAHTTSEFKKWMKNEYEQLLGAKMNRYIDRELALSHPFANGEYDHKNANEDFIIGFESYKEWLEQLPTADVEEVKHGVWTIGVVPQYDRGQGTFCSRCGWAWSNHIDAIKLNPTLSLIKTNYCPNCGAKMDIGGKE